MSFGLVRRREELHESSIFLSVTTRQGFMSRQQFKDAKCHNFSNLGNFLVLGITLSKDVQIEWFKLMWKANSEYYNFHEETFLRKSLLYRRKYPWTYYICLNGDPWRLNGAFPSFLYNSGISSIKGERRYIKEVLKKEEKTLEKKKSEEQEQIIPYIYKC